MLEVRGQLVGVCSFVRSFYHVTPVGRIQSSGLCGIVQELLLADLPCQPGAYFDFIFLSEMGVSLYRPGWPGIHRESTSFPRNGDIKDVTMSS